MARSLWRSVLTIAGILATAGTACAGFDWSSLSNAAKPQRGDATFYGQDGGQDAYSMCSFAESGADASALPWTRGTALSIAMNGAVFQASVACGACIMYRGTGGGIGVTPLSTTTWAFGFVNNACMECAGTDIDQNINGDGRWKAEWYLVPCNVGSTPFHFSAKKGAWDYWGLIVTNTRVPVETLQMKIDGRWMTPHRAENNQWVWPGDQASRHWNAGDFPLAVRITSVAGDTVEDVVPTLDGGVGTAQFKPIGNTTFSSELIPGYGVKAANYKAQAAPATPPLQSAPSEATGTTSSGGTFSGPTLSVPDGGQCGGLGGECTARDRGEPTKPCVAAAWPMAACADPASKCLPMTADGRSAQFFRCTPTALASGGRRLLA